MKMIVLLIALSAAVAMVGVSKSNGVAVILGASGIVLTGLLASMRPPWEGP